MAKFFGAIGYGVTEKDPEKLDIYGERIYERTYYGDVLKDSRQLEKGKGVNDDVRLGNRISILADAYARDHIYAMRYVVWMGAKWKVSDVEVQHPRLILSMGGVYNGPEKDSV